MIEIYAVRHGQTGLNQESVIIGHQPTPITEEGKEEAKLLKAKLKRISFDVIITSDLPRALETATIIQRAFPDIPLLKEKKLREINYGIDTSRKKSEVRKSQPRYHKDPDYKHKGGESFQEVYKRVTDFTCALEGVYKRILLVTHAGCLRALYAFSKSKPLKQHLTMKISHSCVLQFNVENKAATFVAFNEIASHKPGA